jgi:phosphoglycolate phosphatase-like HAD superfamily hydrolase
MSIDLSLSFMVGDAWTDLQAGQAAGVAKVGLVLTGRGRHELKLAKPKDILNAYVFKDLSEALTTLLPKR